MHRSRRTRGFVALVAALTAAWITGAVIGWGGPQHAALASDVAMLLLSTVAAASLLLAARRRPAGRRRAQVLLGVACGCWAVGEGIWGWYEIVLARPVPFPSVADVAYLSATPLAAAGLLSLPRGLRQRSQRARAALDGWLLVGSLLLLSWSFVLEPMLRSGGQDRLVLSVSLSYPVSDLALATIAVLVARHASGSQRRTTLVVVGALLAMAVADSAFTVLQLDAAYTSGGVLDGGWVLGYALLALAGRVDDPDGEVVSSDNTVGRVAALLPYGALGVAALAVVLGGLAGQRVSATQVVILASLVVALLARQALTVLDNVALAAVLELRERHFRSLVHGAKDVIVLCGKDLKATYVSPSSQDVLSLSPDEVVGRPLWELVHPEDLIAVRNALQAVLAGDGSGITTRLRCRITSGFGWIDTESTVGDLRHDPSVAGIVITTRDVSERTALENQLRRQARQDPLTGLANRTVLRERLEHALCLRGAGRSPLGLLLIDLDGFKAVNDTAGHQAGDTLLVEVAARLTAAVRQGDTVARLGGDEFAVLLEDRGDGDLGTAGEVVAERILASVKRPVFAAGRELSVGASLGLVVARADSTAEVMMREGDTALYASKSAGRGRVTLFGPELQAQAARRTELVADLRTALSTDGLTLGYQPVVDLATGVVVGVEALARWDHPVWGYVPPSEFVALAESTGMIDDLGAWALTTAVRQGEAWHAAGRPLGVAVNVSARQLGPDFVAQVARALSGSVLPASHLTLEITESVLVDDDRTLQSLTALRELGVRLAVDDFGTGWSSLAYLRKLPVHVLKLDRSFVAELGNPGADALSRTVLRLAADLGLSVVAEGVETEGQRRMLLEMGCAFAQGWLFGRAVPAGQLPLEHARLQAAGPHWVPEPRGQIPVCEMTVSES